MKGYDVRTVDDDKVGHVVDTDGDFLIVEHGLLKSKHALPRVFAEVDAGQENRTAVAEHHGLAEGFTDRRDYPKD